MAVPKSLNDGDGAALTVRDSRARCRRPQPAEDENGPAGTGVPRQSSTRLSPLPGPTDHFYPRYARRRSELAARCQLPLDGRVGTVVSPDAEPEARGGPGQEAQGRAGRLGRWLSALSLGGRRISCLRGGEGRPTRRLYLPYVLLRCRSERRRGGANEQLCIAHRNRGARLGRDPRRVSPGSCPGQGGGSRRRCRSETILRRGAGAPGAGNPGSRACSRSAHRPAG